MGKNEIKLRRGRLSPADILRYHNYPAVMKHHQRAKRMNKALRFFTYSLLVTIFVLLLLILVSYLWFQVKKKSEVNPQTNSAMCSEFGDPRSNSGYGRAF